jgi:CRP-like cAMP-binding protein
MHAEFIADITGIHRSGDFLGYLELLQDIPYIENAVVLEDVDLSLINKHDFKTILFSNNEVALQFIKLLANNQIENEERLLNLAYQSVRQRVAGALLHIFNTHRDKGNGQITISRKDLANIVGTATESLNRNLADFAVEGIIEIANHGLRIIDKAKLEKLLK